jgi:hypothetical protein
MVQANLSLKSNQIEKDAIEIEQECSVFSFHRIRSNNNHTVSYPNAITSKSHYIQNRLVIIGHNHNRLVTAVHKIHIVLIKC